ncbi:hypothetical protein DFS34DRAFT_594311 [Phlyctochytrium arcticum]|nr:hypothetical protein DFS34DRAFT_594311 [Phlyctochytrium arcticum]
MPHTADDDDYNDPLCLQENYSDFKRTGPGRVNYQRCNVSMNEYRSVMNKHLAGQNHRQQAQFTEEELLLDFQEALGHGQDQDDTAIVGLHPESVSAFDHEFNMHQHLEQDLESNIDDNDNSISFFDESDESGEDDVDSNNGLGDDLDFNFLRNTASGKDKDDGEWFPFPNRMYALCALLIMHPRHVMSESVLTAIWWWGKAMAMELALPPFRSIKAFLSRLKTRTGSDIVESTTLFNNIIFLKDINKVVAQEVANPIVLEHLRMYGEKNTSAAIQELYQAKKWTNDPHFRTPMVKHNGIQYFTGDFAATDTDQKWRGRVEQLRGLFTPPSNGPNVLQGFLELDNQGAKRRVLYTTRQRAMVAAGSALRQRANGRAVILCPLILRVDDASGNRSKKWNCHYTWFMQLAGLPFHERQKDYHTHFLCTSNIASPLELGEPIVSSIVTGLEKGIDYFDAKTLKPVLVIGGVFPILGDNPMHCELTSTMMLQRAHRFCRYCMVTGDLKSADNIIRFTSRGPRRNWAEMRTQVVGHLQKACVPRKQRELRSMQSSQGVKGTYAEETITKLIKIASTENESSASAKKQALGTDEELINPIFRLKGFHGHLDTPVDLLHTVSLGVLKWLYRKDFCAIAQVAIFAFDGFLKDTRYEEELKIAIDNMLVTAYAADAGVFMKRKFHILLHLLDDIKRFGPGLLSIVEKFEASNTLMRDAVIHTNRAAPGRDAAERFARLQTLRHVVSGGYWKNDQGGYQRAGKSVRALMKDDYIRGILGLKNDEISGAERVLKVSEQDGDKDIAYSTTHLQCPPTLSICTRWRWVKITCDKRFGPGEFAGLTAGRLGQLVEILSNPSGSIFLLVSIFERSGERFHGCPVIQRTSRHELISSSDLEGAMNVQHHCSFAGCGSRNHSRIVQERQITEQEHKKWVHAKDKSFIINLFTLQLPWALPPLPLNKERSIRELWHSRASASASAQPGATINQASLQFLLGGASQIGQVGGSII